MEAAKLVKVETNPQLSQEGPAHSRRSMSSRTPRDAPNSVRSWGSADEAGVRESRKSLTAFSPAPGIHMLRSHQSFQSIVSELGDDADRDEAPKKRPMSTQRKAANVLEIEDRRHWSDQRRHACLMFSIFTGLGMLMGIALNEVLWNAQQNLWDPKVFVLILKISICVTTLLAVSYSIMYYEAMISLRRMSGIFLQPGVSLKGLRGAGLLKPLLLDILMLLPQPIPCVDNVTFTLWNKGLGSSSVYQLDTLLVCIMFIRATFLPRFYGVCISNLSSETAMAMGRLNRLRIDSQFIMKYVISNSLQVVSVIFLLQIYIFAYMMMAAERPTENSALRHFPNCLWLVIITMTTVGYGDEYPTTMFGRLVSVMASITAVIMLAIVINLVVSKLTLKRTEAKVMETMDKIQLRKDLKTKSAIVLQRWYRACVDAYKVKSRTAAYMSIPDFDQTHNQTANRHVQILSNLALLEAINDFSEVKEQTFHNSLEIDIPEMIGNLSSKLHLQEAQIEKIAQKAATMQALVHQLATSSANRRPSQSEMPRQ